MFTSVSTFDVDVFSKHYIPRTINLLLLNVTTLVRVNSLPILTSAQ